MKKQILLLALSVSFVANLGFAQITNTNAFAIPEGYKTVSVNISGNGQTAIVGIQKDSQLKYLYYKKTDGAFGQGIENNPLNNLINGNVIPLNPSQSSDGNEIYFAADNQGNTDIFVITKKNGVSTEKVSMGDSINTAANEQYPAISPDGNSFFFTRLQEEGLDKRCGTIYFSNRTPGNQWSKAQDAPEPINLGCEASPYICPDNNTIYFASIREGGKGGFDIYYTQRFDSKFWKIPIPIDTVNFPGDEFSPTWDYQKGELVLTQQDPKKKNNIYPCAAQIPGNFKHSEVSRYYGKTLDLVTKKPIGANIKVTDAFSSLVLDAFQSDGITGEYDFFLNGNTNVFLDFNMPNYSHAIEEIIPDGKEHKKDYTIFNKVNLQLNVFDSDMFEALSSTIIVKADGVKSSVKPTEFAKGRYKMELPIGKNYEFTIKKELYLDTTFNLDLSQIVIFDSFERDVELNSDKNRVKFQVNGLEPGLTTEITIIDISTSSKFTTSITTDQNGKCDIMLRKGDTYKVNILTKGYTMFEKTIDIPKVAKGEDILVIANIAKLEENVRVEIPNVNFETNSYTLDPASYDDLDRAVSLLKLNRDINVELSAHTDDKGSDAYNDKLSEQRAASVAAYIINKGVDKKRIVSKGYGKKQPLVPNTSDENRAKNRRVELKILSTVSE